MVFFGSIYQGAIFVHDFEPQPYLCIYIYPKPCTPHLGEMLEHLLYRFGGIFCKDKTHRHSKDGTPGITLNYPGFGFPFEVTCPIHAWPRTSPRFPEAAPRATPRAGRRTTSISLEVLSGIPAEILFNFTPHQPLHSGCAPSCNKMPHREQRQIRKKKKKMQVAGKAKRKHQEKKQEQTTHGKHTNQREEKNRGQAYQVCCPASGRSPGIGFSPGLGSSAIWSRLHLDRSKGGPPAIYPNRRGRAKVLVTGTRSDGHA